jgi:tetratricopeptide (TPR) repeat protein
LYNLKKIDGAITTYNKAIEINPQNSIALDDKGMLYIN